VDSILILLEEFQEHDRAGGCALSHILNLTVNTNKYNPLHAGHIHVPREIRIKKAVINIQSTNNAYFA